MDKFKLGLFDIFVYTLPGIVVVTTLFLAYSKLSIEIETTIKSLFLVVNNLNFYTISFLLIISYIIGFVFHSLGYLYFVIIGKRIWYNKSDNLEKIPLTFERKFALVRHYSQENFKYIEQWYTLRGMSFNLSLAFLLLFFVLITKIFLCALFKIDWIFISFSCLIFSIVLLKRAITFHKWSHDTLYETIKSLHLEDKQVIEYPER